MKYNFDKLVDRRSTDCYKWDYLDEVFGSDELLPLWVADMDFEVPTAVAEAIQKRAEHAIYGYTGVPDSLYQALIDWQKRRHGWVIKKEWIAFSAGVVAGLNLVIRAFSKPGDEVIVQPPVYRPFFEGALNNERKVIYNPLQLIDGQYKMDFDHLENCITEKTKLLILCSPHNPGGRVWSREELTRLGEICSKHNLLIVADEIHSDFIYPNYQHIPLASISEELAQRTITHIAPNKTFNLAGLASAAVIIPNPKLLARYHGEVERVKSHPNLFGVVAMEAAYRYGEEWLEELLVYLQGNLDFLLEFINQRIPEIKVIKPEGTFLVWLDFRHAGIPFDQLSEFMTKKARVALNDGDWFGPGGEGFMRINIACPRALIEEALKRIENALQQT